MALKIVVVIVCSEKKIHYVLKSLSTYLATTICAHIYQVQDVEDANWKFCPNPLIPLLENKEIHRLLHFILQRAPIELFPF